MEALQRRLQEHDAAGISGNSRYAFRLGDWGTDESLAPLLCGGLIGWRSLVTASEGKKLGLYGFGAAAHIVAQIARWQGRSVFAFTPRGRDHAALRDCHRRDLGGRLE